MAVKSRQYQYIYRILYEAYDVKGAFALKWTLGRVISDSLNKSGEQSEGGPLTWSAILRSQWQWRWGGGWRSQGWLHIDIGQTLITLYPATAQVLFTSLNISDDHRWTFLVVSLQLDTWDTLSGNIVEQFGQGLCIIEHRWWFHCTVSPWAGWWGFEHFNILNKS